MLREFVDFIKLYIKSLFTIDVKMSTGNGEYTEVPMSIWNYCKMKVSDIFISIRNFIVETLSWFWISCKITVDLMVTYGFHMLMMPVYITLSLLNIMIVGWIILKSTTAIISMTITEKTKRIGRAVYRFLLRILKEAGILCICFLIGGLVAPYWFLYGIMAIPEIYSVMVSYTLLVHLIVTHVLYIVSLEIRFHMFTSLWKWIWTEKEEMLALPDARSWYATSDGIIYEMM